MILLGRIGRRRGRHLGGKGGLAISGARPGHGGAAPVYISLGAKLKDLVWIFFQIEEKNGLLLSFFVEMGLPGDTRGKKNGNYAFPNAQLPHRTYIEMKKLSFGEVIRQVPDFFLEDDAKVGAFPKVTKPHPTFFIICFAFPR